MSHTTFTQKWVAGGAALLLGAGISLAAVPGAMAVTQYAGPQTCPSGQYAAIQSWTMGTANHRIWTGYGGTVLKFREFPETPYYVYRATSKSGVQNPTYLATASAYASRSLNGVGTFCSYT